MEVILVILLVVIVKVFSFFFFYFFFNFLLILAPGGFILPSNVNSMGLGYPSFPGANLPNVDPNYYAGTVHFGPSSEIIGGSSFNDYPFGGGYGAPMF